MKSALPTLILILASLVLSSCVSVKPIYYDDDKAVARNTVIKLHDLYNGDDFSGIYDLLTERLKKEQTREQFVAGLTKLKADNGKFVRADESKIQVVPQAAVREVDIKFSSLYEKGSCDEGFAVFVDGKDGLIDLLMINPSNGPANMNR